MVNHCTHFSHRRIRKAYLEPKDARLSGLGLLLLIGAQISDTVRQIKYEMTMHIQIRAAFRHTCRQSIYKHADTHMERVVRW